MSGTRFRVHVTERHINTAIPANSSHCMIADAVKDAIPHAVRIAVDLQTIRWTDPIKGKRYVCFTPPVAQGRLINFDQGNRDQVTPFVLSLRPVQILPAGAHTPEKGPRAIRQAEQPSADGKVHQASPTVDGGKALPLGALSNRRGKRRAFGLRVTNR